MSEKIILPRWGTQSRAGAFRSTRTEDPPRRARGSARGSAPDAPPRPRPQRAPSSGKSQRRPAAEKVVGLKPKCGTATQLPAPPYVRAGGRCVRRSVPAAGNPRRDGGSMASGRPRSAALPPCACVRVRVRVRADDRLPPRDPPINRQSIRQPRAGASVIPHRESDPRRVWNPAGRHAPSGTS